MTNEPLNNTGNDLISGLKILGLLDLPETKEDDEKFIAYGLYVDNKPYLCQKLTKAQYGFSYFLTTPYAWERFLPDKWKSWSLWDIVKNQPLCGSVRP